MGLADLVRNDHNNKTYGVSTVSTTRWYPTQYGNLPADYETAVYFGKPGSFKRPIAFIVFTKLDSALLLEQFHNSVLKLVKRNVISAPDDIKKIFEKNNYDVFEETWRQANFGMRKTTYLFIKKNA